MSKIIGISAKKQGGKTTMMAQLVTNLQGSVEVICFADFLKEIVCKCFAGEHLSWVNTAILDAESTKQTKAPCGKTFRELLQYIGTDVFRKLDPNCWINAYKLKAYNTEKDYIITSDVRFPNEVEAIHAMGGKVIRLTRAPFAQADQHESETALDNYPYFDLICSNEHMSIDEQNQWVKRNINRILC
jgi:hypothetical protein